MKFDGQEIDCVGTEIPRVSMEIVRDPAAMTKNLTEMKSVRAEITRVRSEMSCVSTEIDFVGTEMNCDGTEIDFVGEEIIGAFSEIASSF